MAEEISFESLGLTKSLDKMTAKELRQLCMDKLPMIVGASGKDKATLVQEIKDAFGITDEEGVKVSPYKKQISALKSEIKELRQKKAETTGRKDREIVRRKINKLKKRSRRLAKA